ncbi:MAG: hypothetical protein LQ347_001289 [Umbilicaria vellea]|nr:MAG: hypothetical protein LQ347_001289 [Umbilicaria vellea]
MAKISNGARRAQRTQVSVASLIHPFDTTFRDGAPQVGTSIEDPPMTQTDRNGRPIRKSRGTAVQRKTGFIDSSTIVVDGSDSDLTSSESDVPTAKEDNKRKRFSSSSPIEGSSELSSPLKGRKRLRRASSTAPPALSPAISPLQSRSSTPSTTPDERNTIMLPTKIATSGISNTTLQLTFNVPQGHKGLFEVHIDLASLFGLSTTVTPTQISTTVKTATADTTAKSPIKPFSFLLAIVPKVGTGFNSLPAELRNRIYRLLFVGEPFEFRTGKNFSRSAAFLRTSKRIHEEGRTVLYGENDFCFQRQHNPRGNFYDGSWKEVGYKDVRRFLEMIGFVNISLIRSVKIDFDDAAPSTSPGSTVEQRRFLNDPHLIHFLKLLGLHGKLDYIKMGFYGRRYVYMSDKNFLDTLRQIKANKVEFGHARFQGPENHFDDNRVSSNWPGKIGPTVMFDLKENMLRDPSSDPDVVRLRMWRPKRIGGFGGPRRPTVG